MEESQIINYKVIIKASGNLIFIVGLIILIFTYIPIMYSEANYRIKRNTDEEIVIEQVKEVEKVSENIEPLIPVQNEFTIIIPKIDVNAPIVKDVSTTDENEYMLALREGVAHAKGTALPGENGNMFIFAHSSLNFWQLGAYATVFNLLKKLEPGDTITFFYEGQPYTYNVYEKFIVPGWNTEPFEQDFDEPVVTLITCDPPGSTINRMVVRAKLVKGLSNSAENILP